MLLIYGEELICIKAEEGELEDQQQEHNAFHLGQNSFHRKNKNFSNIFACSAKSFYIVTE